MRVLKIYPNLIERDFAFDRDVEKMKAVSKVNYSKRIIYCAGVDYYYYSATSGFAIVKGMRFNKTVVYNESKLETDFINMLDDRVEKIGAIKCTI